MHKLSSFVLALVGSAMLALPAFAEETIPNPAQEWNHLWSEILVDLLVIGTVFGIASIYLMVKYKAKSPTDVGSGPKLSRAEAIGWALIPAFVFMADDFFLSAKGWTVWNIYRRVPDNAMEVKVNASMYRWEFVYPNGAVTDELVVPVTQPVVLRMTSADVIHGFFLPDYRVKEDVMPGRVTYIWFMPDKPMDTLVTCSMYCGTGHSVMSTKVHAVPRADFDAWMAKNKAHADAGTATRS